MGNSGLFVFPNDPDGERRPGFLTATHLLRVVPVVESCPVADGTVTLVSLDLYADGVILNYFGVAGPELHREHQKRQAEMQRLSRQGDRVAMQRFVEQHLRSVPGRNLYIRLEDDLATVYCGLPRSGGGGQDRWETSYGFTPAVPPAAKLLRVLVFEGDYQRETGEATKRDPEHLIASFEVSL